MPFECLKVGTQKATRRICYKATDQTNRTEPNIVKSGLKLNSVGFKASSHSALSVNLPPFHHCHYVICSSDSTDTVAQGYTKSAMNIIMRVRRRNYPYVLIDIQSLH